MAKTTKDNYGGTGFRPSTYYTAEGISDMSESMREEYLKDRFAGKIISANADFTIHGHTDNGITYDLYGNPEDLTKKLIDYYNGVADYDQDRLEENTFYRLDGWTVVKKFFDPETEEEVESEDLEQVRLDNSYNDQYLGHMDLNWSVFHDADSDKYIFLIHPHLGGDPRGNYGEPFILVGEDLDELTNRFIFDFLVGQATISFEFSDDSSLTYYSETESRNWGFETEEPEDNTIAHDLYESFESLVSEDKDEAITEFYESNSIKKMEDGGVAEEEDTPMVKVRIETSKGEPNEKWFDISEYTIGDDIIDEIEGYADGYDYSFVEYKGFGEDNFSETMTESDFDEIIDGFDLYQESDYPVSLINEFKRDSGVDSYEDAIREMDNNYRGAYRRFTDMVRDMVQEGIYVPNPSDMNVGELDARMIALDKADSEIRSMSFEDKLSKSDLSDEYNEDRQKIEDKIDVLNERLETLNNSIDQKSGDYYDTTMLHIGEIEAEIEEVEEEMDNLPDKWMGRVDDSASEKIIDEEISRLENDLENWLDEHGYFENLTEVSFLRIDYDKIASELEADYQKYLLGNTEYIFNYKNGGTVKVGARKLHDYYLMEMTTKNLVKGFRSKKDALDARKELRGDYPDLRFSVYPLSKVKDKYNIDPENHNSFIDLKGMSLSDKTAVNNRKGVDYTGLYGFGGVARKGRRGVRKARNWVERQWKEADFGDGQGSAKFNNGGDMGQFLPPNTVELYVNDIPHFITRIDSTHVEIVLHMDSIGKGGMAVWHIEQLRDRPFYESVKNWIKGGSKPVNKEFIDETYDAGGEITQLVFVDNDKLGRIQDVKRKKSGIKYVVRTPDGRKRLGRYPAHRVTLAKKGLEVKDSLDQMSEEDIVYIAEKISGKKDRDVSECKRFLEDKDILTSHLDESSYAEFDKLLSGNHSDVLQAREIWSNWSHKNKFGYCNFWIDSHTALGIDPNTGKEINMNVAKEIVNDKLYGSKNFRESEKVIGRTMPRSFKSGGVANKGTKIVESGKNAKLINKVFNDWVNIKDDSQFKRWESKVKHLRFGSKKDKNIIDVISENNPQFKADWLESAFKRNLISALGLKEPKSGKIKF